MPKHKLEKYGTYITPETKKALKRFALEKNVPAYRVIQDALKKCIPEKYWTDK